MTDYVDGIHILRAVTGQSKSNVLYEWIIPQRTTADEHKQMVVT